MPSAITALLAYLLGSLPFGYWFVRLTSGKDIRSMGSGNIGATNVHRTPGKKAGLIVLLLDMAKAFLAVWAADQLTNHNPAAVALAAFAVMLGHCYPLFLGFRGGKAVACYVGAFLYLAPLVLLGVAIIFFLVVRFTKFISLASITAAAIFPVALLTIHPGPELLAACIASSALIIYKHRANIERLRTGQENTFTLSR